MKKMLFNFLPSTTTLVLMVLLLSSMTACSQKTTGLQHLTTEFVERPLGIDVHHPHFGWQMVAPAEKRGVEQKAFQIKVSDAKGKVVWDSGKINGGKATGVKYAGTPLQAETLYQWEVMAWDQDNKMVSASSSFETGLMNPNPDLSAWDGAQWIGGGDDDLVFYAPYQMIFRIKYDVQLKEGSQKAGLIYGANDQRLMDKNKNNAGLENPKDQSFIKLELDISGLEQGGDGFARINIYRAGYTLKDRADQPLHSLKINKEIINNSNKYAAHRFDMSSAFGRIMLRLDDSGVFLAEGNDYKPAVTPYEGADVSQGIFINLNPLGLGGDFLPFGQVCEIGFSAGPGQKARFSNLAISNARAPGNVLFKEDIGQNYHGIFKGKITTEPGAYLVDGGSNGALVVADPSRNSSPMLRSNFELSKDVASARLYVTARGVYEITLNGEKVGNDYYNPGLTQYNKTHMYQTYDVTSMLQKGQNAIGAVMAEGWWSGLLSFVPIWNHFGDRQSLLAKLVIQYKDGTKKVVTTNDKEWKYYNEGPIVYSSLDHGEIYNAKNAERIVGWDKAGFDDSGWSQAKVVPLEGTAFQEKTVDRGGNVTDFNYNDLKLMGQIGNNAAVYKTLKAQNVKEVRKGIFVYDMGQNFVGVPRLTFTKGKAGDTIILRYAEVLYPDLPESGDNVGMIMTENYRAALCRDVYIMNDGPQVFQPKFTSRGYQYIEITGLSEALPVDAVEGIAISSVIDLTADFASSNEKVNKLWSNLVWSNVDNFLSIPTDCPQRNERMGWSGDISVFSRTATYVSNTAPFLKRHMLAMRDVQQSNGKFTDIAPVGGGFGGVLWGSAGITVPWEVYLQYDDLSILEEHYDAMTAYMDYLQTTINPETGVSRDAQLGDWLGPQNNQLGAPYLSTAYHIYDLDIMMKVAELLGKTADKARFAAMHKERKSFFNSKFVNDEGKSMALLGGPGAFMAPPGSVATWKEANTQTSYAVGLALGAFDDEHLSVAGKHLDDAVKRKNVDDNGQMLPEYSLMTGFIGTAWISKALSDLGYDETAYRLLQNESYPSWIYPINQGATSIWERLNSYTVENGFGGNNSMNSFNHYSFGAIGQWLMAYAAGIQRDEPGFKKFILQPKPDPSGKMTWAEGSYESIYGHIYSKWSKTDGGVEYDFVVPANTSATLILENKNGAQILEGKLAADKAKGVSLLDSKDGKLRYQLSSGKYHFTVKNQ